MKNEKLDKKVIATIEKAISQANITYLKKKTKVVDTEYDEEFKKPVREIVEESEYIQKAEGEYDVKKIKELAELWLKLKESDTSYEDTHEGTGGVIILPEVKINGNEVLLKKEDNYGQ